MFRKKKTPPSNSRRDVRRSPQANVFSYYASRSPSEAPARAASDKNGKAAPRRKLIPSKLTLAYVPSYLAGLALAVCLVYVSTLSTQPNIYVAGSTDKRKTLVANTGVYEYEIQLMLAGSIGNRSKLLINTDKLADEIEALFPELGDVSVVLPLVGRRPIIEVQPARQALVLAAEEGPFILDTKGRVLANTGDVDSYLWDDLPRVQDQSGLASQRGNIAITAETVQFIREVAYQLAEKRIPMQSLILPATSANELRLRVEGKPYFVKFDVRGQGRQQVGTYIAVKKKLESDGAVPSQYIDVRVPEKAFYK